MRSQLKKGAILSYLNIIISIVTGFIVSPMLVHGLGESEYGAYQMTAALIGYVSVLDFGLHSSITRFVSKYQANKDERGQQNFIGVSLILFFIIAAMILVIGGILYINVPNIYRGSATEKEIRIIQQLLIVLIINLAISMPGAVFESIAVAYEKFVFVKLSTTVKMLLRFTAILLLGVWHYNALTVVLIDFTLNTLLITAHMVYCFTVLHVKIKIHDCSLKFVKSIFTFSIFVFIAGITDQINWKADTTILGILLGTSAVTFYSVAGNLVGYYKSFSGAISGIFLPKAVKMVAKGKSNKELTDLMIKIGRIQLMVISVILVGFITLGREFISLWMGPEFVDAYIWFLIMAIPLVVPMTQSIGINIIEAKNMHQFRALVYFFIALANILLTVILVKIFGTIGAPIGTGLTMLIGNTFIINWYYSKKVGLEIGRFFREVYLKLAPAILSALLACLILNCFVATAQGWILFIVKGIAVVMIYVVAIWLLGLNKQEKMEILALKGGRKSA